MSAMWELTQIIPQAAPLPLVPDRPVNAMPKGWPGHLLRVWPYAARDEATAQISHVKAYQQLHVTERNAAGFVNLVGGIPDHNPAFVRDLEKGVRDRRAELGFTDEYRPANDPVKLIPTRIIDTAVAIASRKRPDLFEPPAAPHWKLPQGTPPLPSIFEYYCTLRSQRRWDEVGFASLLGLSTRKELHAFKQKAIEAVWIVVPEEHRRRAWGDIP